MAAGQFLAEIVAGDIRQLMGFVENHDIAAWDDLPETAFFDYYVRQEQMMVDHQDIRIHGLAEGLDHKVLFVFRVVAAEAIIGVLVTSRQIGMS